MNTPKHFRFTVRGDFATTPEQWSYGFHFQRIVSGDADGSLGNIDEGGVTDALTDFHSLAMFDQGCRLLEWRAYEIGEDGKMAGNGPLLHVMSSPVTGGGAAQKYPTAVSLCVSTIADNRGPAKRGRFYLPGLTLALNSDFRITAVQAQQVATDSIAMLKGISDSIDLPGIGNSADGVNVSGLPGSTGTIQSIDHLEVGRVFDTMRSRRTQLLEAREVSGQIDW